MVLFLRCCFGIHRVVAEDIANTGQILARHGDDGLVCLTAFVTDTLEDEDKPFRHVIYAVETIAD